ncbi:23S rRNA (pseudouridine(1915)-N(3))-methyltransferase RlmH [Pleionea sp. CnH1-48]|uniref:23S rRNA (pseudouridine(1915)-N(3))-methyltransferase RlmH n=1 Tax=Pleionea sp. CnH1-48 TaxID=2954494 RepID=UPI00209773EB|nr:23S rRNA (pseudouridine(1915)-N(3))-methyltransferase RlmH [Pleionea sp. CnH1-48]MCO7227381.1 23S rRNA (pseudouridine(1915)-N(3))-methyltransferase RlmH [Pleionea sp. CnH1-48]
MIIKLIAVGHKMPAWVETGYQEFARRMPRECRLELVEIAAAKRGKQADIPRIMAKEAQQMKAAIHSSDRVVALDVKGKHWSTQELSQKLTQWQQLGSNVSLLVGGPEGMTQDCLQMADEKWSLSALTLPHPLVRVVVAEALYRAWTLTVNHPYHRE